MTRAIAAAIGVLIVSATASTTWAKGPTVMIAIEGSGLTTPIYVRDTAVEQFHVWAGPGTRMNGIEGTEGFIVDWSSKVSPEEVTSLQQYQLSFYTKQWNRASQTYVGEQLAYVVSYAYDAAVGQGYVYLPSARDVMHRINASTIYRGPRWEGRWYRATPAWQKLVTPLLAAAQRP